MFGVSMAELMRVVASLPEQQQHELAAFLLHLRMRDDPAWRAEMTLKIDDKNEANWVLLEELKKEFGAGEER